MINDEALCTELPALTLIAARFRSTSFEEFGTKPLALLFVIQRRIIQFTLRESWSETRVILLSFARARRNTLVADLLRFPDEFHAASRRSAS